jgi:hypothetical protein
MMRRARLPNNCEVKATAHEGKSNSVIVGSGHFGLLQV